MPVNRRNLPVTRNWLPIRIEDDMRLSDCAGSLLFAGPYPAIFEIRALTQHPSREFSNDLNPCVFEALYAGTREIAAGESLSFNVVSIGCVRLQR